MGRGGPRQRNEQTVVVWMLNPDKSLHPVKVKVGITDLNVTELVEGEIKEGDQIITGSSIARSAGPPRLGGQPGGQPGGGQRR